LADRNQDSALRNHVKPHFVDSSAFTRPGHHAIAFNELRGVSVKARRPRARAVEAKRRALHADEHSASIRGVMAGVTRLITLVVQEYDFTWSTNMLPDWTKSSG
jgi:hypothetical protein